MKPKRMRYMPIGIVCMLLAGSLGCRPEAAEPLLDATTEPEVQETASFEMEIDLGSGDMDLGDMRIGLDQLTDYQSNLTISFDGSEAGSPVRWETAYSYIGVNAPAARQVIITASGDQAPTPLWIAEIGGVAYQRDAEGRCVGTLPDEANPWVGELEPAGQLPGVFGAEEAGSEEVNGIQAVHYTFDERALAETGLGKSTGELWLAAEGGYVVRYHLNLMGDESYFGEGTQGEMSWNYELQRPAEPSIIELPADCPPGLLDVPMMADAAEVERLPGMTRYSTAASVAEVQAFYEEELAVLGWKPPAPAMSLEQMGISADEYQQAMQALQAMGMAQPAPTPDPSRADLVFQHAERLLQVTITRLQSSTDVEVSSR